MRGTTVVLFLVVAAVVANPVPRPGTQINPGSEIVNRKSLIPTPPSIIIPSPEGGGQPGPPIIIIPMPPIVVEPEIGGESPIVVEPEIGGESPIVVEPEIGGESPIVVEPEIGGESPIVVEPEIGGESPIVVEPEAEGESPIVVEPDVGGESPIVVEPEIDEESPIVVEPEIDEESPIVVEPEPETEGEFLPNGCPIDPHIHWLLPNEQHCNQFYACVWGDKVPRQCSASLHFNRELQVCDWPSEAGCEA